MANAAAKRKPTRWSERVVVDEIFENGSVRLLRSSRLPDAYPDNFGIECWGEEREEFHARWRVEAFVGYPSGRALGEGDVFFIADGRKLVTDYDPIERNKARKLHLLRPSNVSREIARTDIKREYYKLAATRLIKDEKEREQILGDIDQRFEKIINLWGGE